MAPSQTVGSATFTYGEKVLYIWRSICFDSEKKNIWWKIWLNYDQMKLIGYIHWECAEDKSNTHTHKNHTCEQIRIDFVVNCTVLISIVWWHIPHGSMVYEHEHCTAIFGDLVECHSVIVIPILLRTAHPRHPSPSPICAQQSACYEQCLTARISHPTTITWSDLFFFFSLTSSNPSRKYRRVSVCVHANARARANKICAHAWCCWSSF